MGLRLQPAHLPSNLIQGHWVFFKPKSVVFLIYIFWGVLDNQGFGAPAEGEIINLALYQSKQDTISWELFFIFKVKRACKLK